MNFTLGLLGGLLLILPGLAALVAWHVQSGRDGVRRAEIPLTSVVALVLVLGVSLLSHLFGWALTELVLASIRELYPVTDTTSGAILENPYALAVRLAEKRTTGNELEGIVTFLCIVGFEALFAAAIISSRGLTLAMGDFDAGNQGWVFQNVILPTRHGAKPIAFVLTNIPSGKEGLAYRGVVVEARQGPDGDLKGLTLASPETFIYSVRKPSGGMRGQPQIRLSANRSLDGIMTLEVAAIRNILVQQIPDAVVDEIVTDIPSTEAVSEEFQMQQWSLEYA